MTASQKKKGEKKAHFEVKTRGACQGWQSREGKRGRVSLCTFVLERDCKGMMHAGSDRWWAERRGRGRGFQMA